MNAILVFSFIAFILLRPAPALPETWALHIQWSTETTIGDRLTADRYDSRDECEEAGEHWLSEQHDNASNSFDYHCERVHDVAARGRIA